MAHTRPSANCPACGAVLLAEPEQAAGSAVPRAAVPPSITAALLRAGMLSPRERLAFQLLGQGRDNRAIARELMISERTAKRHVTAILAKLNLESRLQAGITALIMSSRPGPATTAHPGEDSFESEVSRVIS